MQASIPTWRAIERCCFNKLPAPLFLQNGTNFTQTADVPDAKLILSIFDLQKFRVWRKFQTTERLGDYRDWFNQLGLEYQQLM